jgi:hypothetical protein
MRHRLRRPDVRRLGLQLCHLHLGGQRGKRSVLLQSELLHLRMELRRQLCHLVLLLRSQRDQRCHASVMQRRCGCLPLRLLMRWRRLDWPRFTLCRFRLSAARAVSTQRRRRARRRRGAPLLLRQRLVVGGCVVAAVGWAVAVPRGSGHRCEKDDVEMKEAELLAPDPHREGTPRGAREVQRIARRRTGP